MKSIKTSFYEVHQDFILWSPSRLHFMKSIKTSFYQVHQDFILSSPSRLHFIKSIKTSFYQVHQDFILSSPSRLHFIKSIKTSFYEVYQDFIYEVHQDFILWSLSRLHFIKSNFNALFTNQRETWWPQELLLTYGALAWSTATGACSFNSPPSKPCFNSKMTAVCKESIKHTVLLGPEKLYSKLSLTNPTTKPGNKAVLEPWTKRHITPNDLWPHTC